MTGVARPRSVGLLVYAQSWGGMAVHTIRLAEVLHARGHRVVVLQFGNPVLTPEHFRGSPGLELRTASLSRPPGLVGFREWSALFRNLDCEVGVHAKGWTRFGNLRLDLAGRLAFKRFLAIEHLTPPPPPRRSSRRHLGGLVPGLGLWWRSAVLGVYLRSLAPQGIITVSQGIADELTDGYAFPRGKTIPVPNGIDPQRFIPDPVARAEVRRAWGIPPDDLVFGSVARLWNFQKGFDLAVDCFARLRREHPERPVWYVLVGEGEDREALERQAAGGAAAGRVLFPGLTLRPWEAFAAIDIFLMPSRFEGIGLSLMEAMAAECCPIAMAAGGIKEVVSDPRLGWLVPAGDRDAYYAAMVAAAGASADDRRRMGRLARQHIEERFDAVTQYGRLADVIERA
jgi:glycosyltransferase involved in cell wall biosynthesis